MNNILITGGAGFIGSSLSLELIKRGYEVTVLDNLLPQIHGENPKETSDLYNSIKGKVNFIHSDINNRENLKKAIQSADTIVHLAAETGTGQSMYEVDRYVKVNVGGTGLLLDLLVNETHQVKKVLVASSRSIYGEGKYLSNQYGVVYPKHRIEKDMLGGDFRVKYKEDNGLELLATDEESKIHPSSVYGITKQNQEQMVMTVCQSLGISSVALRYQNVYGPGQSLKNPYTGILSIFSTQIRNGNELNIFEDGLESRDFVFIDDVVRATVLSIENQDIKNDIFNVGSGIAVSVMEVAETLKSHYQKEVPVRISGNFRLGDIRHNFADLTKIKERLGFVPQVGFTEGSKLFANWVKRQGIMKDNYQKSISEMRSKGLLK